MLEILDQLFHLILCPQGKTEGEEGATVMQTQGEKKSKFGVSKNKKHMLLLLF